MVIWFWILLPFHSIRFRCAQQNSYMYAMTIVPFPIASPLTHSWIDCWFILITRGEQRRNYCRQRQICEIYTNMQKKKFFLPSVCWMFFFLSVSNFLFLLLSHWLFIATNKNVKKRKILKRVLFCKVFPYDVNSHCNLVAMLVWVRVCVWWCSLWWFFVLLWSKFIVAPVLHIIIMQMCKRKSVLAAASFPLQHYFHCFNFHVRFDLFCWFKCGRSRNNCLNIHQDFSVYVIKAMAINEPQHDQPQFHPHCKQWNAFIDCVCVFFCCYFL